jgi:ATP-dependent DNA helicase RecQ
VLLNQRLARVCYLSVVNQPTPIEVLKKFWGYDHFRHPQEGIINEVMQGRDVLALLPTGGGKSICFQVPALIMDGLCVVITPLIALMQDQVSQLKNRGITAVAVHSGLGRQELDWTLDNCVYGRVRFLYVSPERVQTEIFQERFKRMKVNLVAVDEAHCISQWGHDFRPPYLQLEILREIKPDVPVIALTASATERVKGDIIAHVPLHKPAVFQISFARPNISFVVRQSENKEKKLVEILKRVAGPAIVYVRSRKATAELAKLLTRQKISATFYHAGLNHEDRMKRQEEWIQNRARVVVATNAFGMGIDKPDVRVVIHMDLPEDLESYYQEAGRAGRDGKKSYAAVVYHPSDIENLALKVEQANPSIDYLRKVYQALANFFQLAVGGSEGEGFDFDLEEFSKRFNLRSASAFVALKKLEQEGFVSLSESFYRPSRLHFSVDKKRLYEFQVAQAHFDPLIKTLLRLYGGELLTEFVAISESQIGSALKWTSGEVKATLEQLAKLQLIDYEPASDSPRLTFVLARQDADTLPINKQRLDERRNWHLTKMKAMTEYVTQQHRCRMQVLQRYFDEETELTCGVCDVCIERKKKENFAALLDYREQITYLLNQKPQPVDELEEAVGPKDHELFIEVVREMVDEGIVRYDEFWMLHKK